MPRTKTIFIFAILLFAISGIWFFATKKNAPESTVKNTASEKQALKVTIKKASDLKRATFEERFPALIVPANETVIVAETSGTVSSANFEVGSAVAQGAIIVRITNPTGTTLTKNGIQSEAIRQAEIAASSARKSYKEAKRLAEKNTNKESYLARDLARLRLESAEIELANALDASIVRAPLSGIVSEKNVDIGSSVSPGATMATIASSGAQKIRFQISGNTRRSLAIGDSARIFLGKDREEKAHIASIALVADSATGKFPVEARFEKEALSSETIATVVLQTKRFASEASEFFLPLSALTTGQDGSFFFIVENEIAKKITIPSLSVSGETALVRADIPEDAHIIIESAGTLEDGIKIRIREK